MSLCCSEIQPNHAGENCEKKHGEKNSQMFVNYSDDTNDFLTDSFQFNMNDVSEKDIRPERIGRLSKAEKKQRFFERKCMQNKSKRKQRRKEHKERKTQLLGSQDHPQEVDDNSCYVHKRETLHMRRLRCVDAMEDGQRICVDLSMEDLMSKKEVSRLVQQLCRLYGSNRKAENPAHLFFTGLDKSGLLYSECVRKNEGFDKYLVTVSEEFHTDMFTSEEIVYLSPDSENVLTSIDKDKVYIIGGLVDDNIHKGVTHSRAYECSVSTARLPIQECMDKVDLGPGATWSQVLTVNQVFDILLEFTQSHDWPSALLVGVPKRKGFVSKDIANSCRHSAEDHVPQMDITSKHS